MSTWAIVPFKSIQNGKSRLAGVLSQAERADLNQRFLIRTLETLQALPEIERTLVVSRDMQALQLAREWGAQTLVENGKPHLNDALVLATRFATQHKVDNMLILPADLPLITSFEVRALLERAINPPVVVIAPDRHRQGTNALLINPAGLLNYHFGKNSFQRYSRQVVRSKARLEVCNLLALSLDVDFPEDLELVNKVLDHNYQGGFHD